MRLMFLGADKPITIERGLARTLEVENCHLFARICRSIAPDGVEAPFEPFTLWDDEGNEVAPLRSLLMISDPLHLPWDNSELSGKLLIRMESLLFEDEDARSLFEEYGRRLRGFAQQLTHQVEGDYRFNVQWDMRRFLKAFGFAADRGEDLPFIDTLNMFLDFASDMKLERLIIFVNLKTFLEENEFAQFLDRVFFHGFEVLLLENKLCDIQYDKEQKTLIDQHFLEM